jgi:hypothetical protein
MKKKSNFIEECLQDSLAKDIEEGRQLNRKQTWKENWEKGWTEGWRKGWKEGWWEGRRDGQIKVILTQLEKVLGPVRPDLERKIRLLTDNEIENLAYDLLDIKAIKDLETWFKATSPE